VNLRAARSISFSSFFFLRLSIDLQEVKEKKDLPSVHGTFDLLLAVLPPLVPIEIGHGCGHNRRRGAAHRLVSLLIILPAAAANPSVGMQIEEAISRNI